MGFSWVVFIAQIVNFLILVFLLKHFLYGPLLNAMERREQRIASRFDEAEAKHQNAEEEAESYRNKRRELEEQREKLLNEAREEAESKKKEMLHTAREEMDQLRAKWRDALEREKDTFLKTVRRTVAKQVVAAVRKILADLADASLEHKLVDRFVDRLGRLDEDARREMADSTASADKSLVVATAFDVSEDDREKIQDAARNLFADEAAVQFRQSEDLICGIELKAGGRKVAWSVEDYLDAIEEELTELIEEQSRGGSREKAKEQAEQPAEETKQE